MSTDKIDAADALSNHLSMAKGIAHMTMLAAQGADSNERGLMAAIHVQDAMGALISHLSEISEAVDTLGLYETEPAEPVP